jgi:TPR repeat protein
VEKDAKLAFQWFQRSASRHADSLFMLGLCHLRGEGVKQDVDEGANLIQQAALQDSAEARAWLTARGVIVPATGGQ